MKLFEEDFFFAACYIFYHQVSFHLYSMFRSSHYLTNLTLRPFSQEQFPMPKFSSILHALLHFQPHVLKFYM